jgi:hypothetical protein
MEIAEVGGRLDDPLAVQFQHHPKHAMGAGMLGAHVQEQFFAPPCSALRVGCPIDLLFLLGNFTLGLFLRGFVQAGNERKRAAPASPFGRKVFSQGMAFLIVFRQQNATKVRMPGKGDPHQVVHFAFHELGALPDAGDGRDLR